MQNAHAGIPNRVAQGIRTGGGSWPHTGIVGATSGIAPGVTLKLRHDFNLPVFVGVIRRILWRRRIPSFSFPIKHFEIPFRVRHAQNTNYAPVGINGKRCRHGDKQKMPPGHRWTRDVLLPRLLSGKVNLKEN
jgi:hypothetical protein